jgi:putative flippase GtrA
MPRLGSWISVRTELWHAVTPKPILNSSSEFDRLDVEPAVLAEHESRKRKSDLSTQLTETAKNPALTAHAAQRNFVVLYRCFEFVRFLGAVGIGTALYYVAFFVLTELGVWYILSSVLSFAVCYSTTFLFQKFWAFRNCNLAGTQLQVKKYTGMVLLLFMLNTIYLYFLVEHIYLWYITAQVIASIILTPLSYWATKRIFAQ